MNILIEAQRTKLPQMRYGGMPRVVWSLARALNSMGHNVSVLCAKGSFCPFAQIIERNPSVSIESQIPPQTDVVHFNTPVPDNFDHPYVETIHGNFNKTISRNAIFLSKNHAMRFGSSVYVYNGLDWDDAEYSHPILTNERTAYHFLGKAAWKVKNVRGAISVAKHLRGEKLNVLGGYRLNMHMGFRFTLSPKIRFFGMCKGDEKRSLLSASKGLIFPVVWHEPFGLAVIESLYFGAPVFATPYGALPEIVTPNVGALTNSESLMIELINNAHFSPQICHEYARDTFNAMRMAQGYLKKYEEVANGNFLHASSPIKISPEEPTPWIEM